MTDDDNNGIQAEQGLPPRNGSVHGESEGTSGESAADSGTKPGTGELDRSRDRAAVLNGDIQDDAEAYDPDEELTTGGTRRTVSIHHQGPLPEASQLAAYANAGADFPERIVRMTEKQVDSRIESMDRLSKADAFATYAGMTMVSLLTLAGLVGAFVGGVLYDKPGAFSLVALPVLNYLPKLIDAIKGNNSED